MHSLVTQKYIWHCLISSINQKMRWYVHLKEWKHILGWGQKGIQLSPISWEHWELIGLNKSVQGKFRKNKECAYQLVADNVQVSTSYLHLNVIHRSCSMATMTLRKDVLQLLSFICACLYVLFYNAILGPPTSFPSPNATQAAVYTQLTTLNPTLDSSLPFSLSNMEATHYYAWLPSSPCLVAHTSTTMWAMPKGLEAYCNVKQFWIIVNHKLNTI